MTASIRSLRERVDLFQRKLETDQVGGFKEKWEKVRSTWASISPLYTSSARAENVKGIRLGGKEIQSLGYKIMLNGFFKNVPFQRIVWQGRTLALTTQLEWDFQHRFAVGYASELLDSEQGE